MSSHEKDTLDIARVENLLTLKSVNLALDWEMIKNLLDMSRIKKYECPILPSSPKYFWWREM
jgi:hypothetical protein